MLHTTVDNGVLFCPHIYLCVLGLIVVSSTSMICRHVCRVNIHSHWKQYQIWQRLAAASSLIQLTKCSQLHLTCKKKLSSWYLLKTFQSSLIYYWLKRLKPSIAVNGKPIKRAMNITCHMGSHSVTCHPTQANAPCHNPSRPGRYSIYLPWKDGWLSRPR